MRNRNSTRLINSTIENSDAFKVLQTGLAFSKIEALSLLANASPREVELIPVVVPMLKGDLYAIIQYISSTEYPKDANLTSARLTEEMIEWFPTHPADDFPETFRNGTKPVMPKGFIPKLLTAKKFPAMLDAEVNYFHADRKLNEKYKSDDATNPGVNISPDKFQPISVETESLLAKPEITPAGGSIGFTNREIALAATAGATLLVAVCLVAASRLGCQASYVRKTVKSGLDKGYSLVNGTYSFLKSFTGNNKTSTELTAEPKRSQRRSW